MAAGLRVRVVNTQDGSVLERTFDRSPVRIGRSSLNELQIQAPFVSQYHAVIEFEGSRLQLRDLGSTNGTALRASGRVPPNTPVDLTQQNYEFAIISLWFQLFFVSDVAPAKVERKREGTILSMDVNELQKMMAGLPANAGLPSPAADRSKEQIARLQPAYDEYRAGWAKLYRELFSLTNGLEAPARARLLQQMQTDMGPVSNEGDFQRLASQFGVAPAAGPEKAAPAGTREETVALQALRDLASSFVPQRGPLERVVDVVAFAQKMQDVLDVFFKCFLPLRDGHKQFQTQMDIKKTRSPKEAMNAARAVETAREPRELAARVLDWGDPTNDGSRAIESTFAEVMVHQVAMLNGVMRGVRSLLAKLAPASIEAELGNPRRRTANGMQIGPFRYKTLWELYAEIYGDFAEDEKQAFMLIFGPEFVHAYSELAGDAPVGGGSPGAPPAPHAFGQIPGMGAQTPSKQPFGQNQGPHAFQQNPGPPLHQSFPQAPPQHASQPPRAPSLASGPVSPHGAPQHGGPPMHGAPAPPPMVTPPPVTHPPQPQPSHPGQQQGGPGQPPPPPPMVQQPPGPWTGGSGSGGPWTGGGGPQRR